MTFLAGLTAIPLTASTESDGPGGLEFDVSPAYEPGHPVEAAFHVDAADASKVSWNWTVTWADGTPAEAGQGLPVHITHSFDQPAAVDWNVTVTTLGGQTGWMDLRTTATYQDDSPWVSLNALVHNPPAAGAALGTLAGFLALMFFVLRGNPQAGLPLLNGGAVAGFLVGLYVATGSFQFW